MYLDPDCTPDAPSNANWHDQCVTHMSNAVVQLKKQQALYVQLDQEYRPNSPGKYFTFNHDAWRATFDSYIETSLEMKARVCRNGALVDDVVIDVFAPEYDAFKGQVTQYIGRLGPTYNDAATGDWQHNDIIVKRSTSCTVSCYDVH